MNCCILSNFFNTGTVYFPKIKIGHVHVYFIDLSCESIDLKNAELFSHFAEFFFVFSKFPETPFGTSQVLAVRS
jgi:hypothetical protein